VLTSKILLLLAPPERLSVLSKTICGITVATATGRRSRLLRCACMRNDGNRPVVLCPIRVLFLFLWYLSVGLFGVWFLNADATVSLREKMWERATVSILHEDSVERGGSLVEKRG
jgi:hypothetical protein